MSPHVIVGASIAAMAAVERLTVAGEQVRWLVTGPVGGAFAPKEIDGHPIGFGLRLIEREYVAGENLLPTPPLSDYVPGHAGHRPWMGWVADYLDDLVPDLMPSATPRLALGTSVGEDFTLTGRLAAISDLLDARTRDRIAHEVTAIAREKGPAGVLEPPGPLGLSLHDASLGNHGRLFHTIVVDPIASALVAGGATVVEAIQRHKVWAPLYWPETLRQAATGQTPDFDPRRQFWTDHNGGMSDVVTALDRRIAASPAVTRLDVGPLTSAVNAGLGTRMTFESGHEEHASSAILASSPSETFAAAGIPHHADRVAMSMLWLSVDEGHVTNPAPITFLDDEIVFRVCAIAPRPDSTGTIRRTFSVELRNGAPPDARHVIRSLVRTGVIAEAARPTALGHRRVPAFAVPTAANRHGFDQAVEDLRDALPATRLLGALAGYGADPMNEQLFSGLRVAQEVCGAHV